MHRRSKHREEVAIVPTVVPDVNTEPDPGADATFGAPIPASWCLGCSHLSAGGGTTACAEAHGCYLSRPEIWLG